MALQRLVLWYEVRWKLYKYFIIFYGGGHCLMTTTMKLFWKLFFVLFPSFSMRFFVYFFFLFAIHFILMGHSTCIYQSIIGLSLIVLRCVCMCVVFLRTTLMVVLIRWNLVVDLRVINGDGLFTHRIVCERCGDFMCHIQFELIAGGSGCNFLSFFFL